MPPIEHLLRIFCDGAICAGHLISIGESDVHNRVQDEVTQAGMAIAELEDGRSRLGALLLHEHSWVQYYAACCLLKCDREDAGAVKTLENLATLDDWVAPRSEITLHALRSAGHRAGRH